MSGSNNKASESLLSYELFDLCNSWSLSTDRLHKSIERHGFAPKDTLASDYKFFLRACINKTITEEIIQWLLEYFPAAISATDYIGQSPLHYACANKGMKSVRIIQLLIDADPNCVRSVDNHGRMPLHVLRIEDETAELEVLKLLIKKCPEAVRHANNRGSLPIHIAAKTSRSAEFCRLLIEAYPGSERIAGSCRRLPLHWACELNAVATVQYLYKLYPDAINHADTKGLYPIDCAITGLRKRADPEGAIETVQYLLDCDPNVKLQKRGGESLLEFICQRVDNYSILEAKFEMIKTIYDAHPEAIEDDGVAQNIHNFHIVVQTLLNGELIYARQARNHRRMMTADDNGRLPLHIALQNNVMLGSIKLFVKGNPAALQYSDNGGALPLHIACQHHYSASVIQYLIGLDTTTLDAADRGENTALHYACRGAQYKTISMLLDKYDAVFVSKRNADNKLPIDLLWESNAVEDRESVEYTESVFQLLKAYPEMIMNCNMSTKQQVTPVDFSSQNGKKRKLCA
mmetsp:Transcript_22145/g.34761  ORF Transcript_22145/g.34761 Transcript_22145/m.34761 type:complete len:517 (-) Transcript_22145:181-1731(-)